MMNKKWNIGNKKMAAPNVSKEIRMGMGIGFIILLLGAGFWWWSMNQLSNNTGIQNCQSISRETYGIAPTVFELLPPPPACFYTLIDAYRSGTFTNSFFFNKKYYTQPEFFPAFKKDGLDKWKNPTANVWGAVGYGAYPYSLTLNLRPGETTRARFFVYASFGIRTFQGMRIETLFPNPIDANHISVKIISDASDGFILGPSFPKFNPAWVHPVDLEITAAKNIPPETLFVNFRVKSPSDKIDSMGVEKYGNNYYPATAYVGERTPAILSVTILPEKN